MTGKSFIAASLLASLAAPASAGFEPIEASIPFIHHGGIRDWSAVDSDTLYVQDAHRNWYRAQFMVSCFDLPFAEAIGFETRGADRFDRFGSVIVRGRSCPLKSLVASGPPLPKALRKKSS